MTEDDGPWVLIMRGGKIMRQRPYCDCLRPAHGYRKRDDGAWVRPCCMRRERQAFERIGDGPVEHNPATCQWCREAEHNRADPVLSQNQT